MTDARQDPHLDAMITAARTAGAQLLHRFHNREALLIEYKNPGDLVSIADRESEETIIQILDSVFPAYGILGEEGGSRAIGADGFRWIIDPLDATGNFLNGIPFWCVTIALARHDELVAGVTYDPVHNELFYALKEQGAFLNDGPIQTNNKKLLKQAAIGLDVGAPPIAPLYGSVFKYSLEHGATALNVRCCALSLAYVALGRFDVFAHMSKTKPWDMAAGALLVREAGGVVTDIAQNPLHLEAGSVLCAANQTLYDQFVPLLKA